ncbi:MAG: aldehyde ferredoxin oxidoreductase C-terminal domain-containing protein [Chloroflexota bacterium]
MSQISSGGYHGRILRVDLTREQISEEYLDDATLRKFVGGTGLGAKYLYEEVPPGVRWDSPENRLIFCAGPASGTRLSGSGTYAVVSKGPMTELAAASQANGFFGAFLKFSGYDGVIIQGAAKHWKYLHIHDGTAELRSASHLLGRDAIETQETIKGEIGQPCSVVCIGPGGENLVRFACIVGDSTHVCSKGGVGAVMGAKKLKAIVAERGKTPAPVKNPEKLAEAAAALLKDAQEHGQDGQGLFTKYGTLAFFRLEAESQGLPVKNYTTTVFPEYERFTGEYLRTRFESKPTPCWACRFTGHCRKTRVTEGRYAGFEGDEPEYETLVAMGSTIGQTDPGAAVVLGEVCDRLGLDCNESGWLVGWLMECSEKKLLPKEIFGDFKIPWGDAEATAELLYQIAHRQGLGDLLSDGVKRVAEKVGGEAAKCGIYTLKGSVPRGSDHRVEWYEALDTSVSSTATIEVVGHCPEWDQHGVTPLRTPEAFFNPETVVKSVSGFSGRRQFEDCLGMCSFNMHDLKLIINTLNAVTGWEVNQEEAMQTGRRIINLLRLFNYRHGMTKEMEAPSPRYGSAQPDGPFEGKSILPHWEKMRADYYEAMGWDRETGEPLPSTLEKLGLGHLVGK